jgi:hypothetical protein
MSTDEQAQLLAMDRDEQRAFLRKFRHPIGARVALGRKYIRPQDIPRMGAAIEKRARKALARQRNAMRQGRR